PADHPPAQPPALRRRRLGAMQFLQISEVTRRKLMLEELLLMVVRMGLLAVLVFALAGPFFETSLATRLSGRPPRDVVLVFDGSASMGATDPSGTRTPHAAAKEWALSFLDDLQPGDSVAILLAREQVVPLVGDLSVERDR